MVEPKVAPLSDEPASPKRQAILEAAKNLFLSEPYDRVSMDAVAAAANVSKVTIYAHFSNKERLFADAIGAGCLALFDEAVIGSRQHGDLGVVLADLGFRFVENITSPEVSALHGVMIAESQRRPELTRIFYDGLVTRSINLLAEILSAATAQGRLACPHPRRAAVQFLAMVQGDYDYRCQLGLGSPDPEDLRAYTADCARIFLRAYAP